MKTFNSVESYLKKKAKERDDYICWYCGFVGKVQMEKQGKLVWVPQDDLVQADHITPKGMKGKNVLENFQTLCKPCHKRKTVKDRKKIKQWRKANGIV